MKYDERLPTGYFPYEGKAKDHSGTPLYVSDTVVYARNNMYMELDSGIIEAIEEPNKDGYAIIHIRSQWSGRTSKRISLNVQLIEHGGA